LLQPASPQDSQLPYCVLVVCTGNVHRSPLIERLFVQRLGPQGRQSIRISSAGTAAQHGTPMAPQTAALLMELGGDPDGAAARRLTGDLVNRSALVLGAAAEHREAAVRMSPVWALPRAFTLREFARLLRPGDAVGRSDPADRLAAMAESAAARRGSGGATDYDDVDDPQGASPEVARLCAARIEEAVEWIVRAVLG
jgi:protein-tyrosine phosphatase